ncbi:MAG: 23S rRNA (guanosine(2251)-2'-O)-methyltransferase RlmB [Candidatus Nanopelagicales bacterium]|jgi:23S rRNA (guanosine2251-2'-O)-methyltransferase|nr:23S rRNA (guanosine(2251)-2'-O)-methyltransferase RlmB [Candidatus Nanopelagicales bacterium]
MAGNSQRRGAMRRAGTKKGATVGSGGQSRQKLEGKGPTPRAEDRPGHVAQQRKQAAQRGGDRRGGRPGGGGGGASGGRTGGSGSRAGGSRGKPATEAVAGRNAVLEALQAGIPASALHVQQYLDADDRVRAAMQLAVGRGVPLLETTRGDLDRLSGGAVHQGIVLQVPPYRYADGADLLGAAYERGEQPLVVVLDGVTDPRNLGAVVRSAAAFGAHGVVIPERRAAGMTAAAWKTSAGAASRVPVARVTNLVRWLTAAQKDGATVLGLAMGGRLTLPELDAATAAGPVVLVVGSEGKGLGHLVSQTCDDLVAIPMDAATESLNAGVAAGIALYAVATARRG